MSETRMVSEEAQQEYWRLADAHQEGQQALQEIEDRYNTERKICEERLSRVIGDLNRFAREHKGETVLLKKVV